MPSEPANAPSLAMMQQLARFAALVRGSPHNLLSPQALSELETRHIPESLAFASSLPDSGRLLDIGSGGGLPGLVLAIVRPALEVHLLDATGKKAAFLREVVEELQLSVTVHHGRAEDLGVGDLARSFAAVTARAVARLEKLAAWSAPFLAPGGALYAIKGARWREELEEATGALTRLGLRVVSLPQEHEGAERGHAPRVVVLGRSH